MTASLQMILPSDLEEIPGKSAQMAAFLEECDAPPHLVFQAELVLEEIVTNIIKYGLPPGANRQIQVDLTWRPQGLRMEISDDGLPFDPRQAPQPNLDLPAEERPVGGVGLHLVRKAASFLEYRREGDHNRLEIELSASPPSSSQGA